MTSTPRRRPARTSVTTEIMFVLRDEILSGRLGPGDQLPTERELAREFGVSQPSIREAVRGLEAMSLIDVRHGSGSYVTGDPAEILWSSMQAVVQLGDVGMAEVIELRSVLAQYSVERAAQHITDADVELIKQREQELLELDAIDDVDEAAEVAVRFMVSVAEAAHHPLLLAIDTVLIRLLVGIHLAAFREDGMDVWREWSMQFAPARRELVDRLEARDCERATGAMLRYLTLQKARFAEAERSHRSHSRAM